MESPLLISFLVPLAGTALGVAAGAIVTVYVLKERINSFVNRLGRVEEAYSRVEHEFIRKETCQDCKAFQSARHNEILRRLENVEIGVKESAETVKHCFDELVLAFKEGRC